MNANVEKPSEAQRCWNGALALVKERSWSAYGNVDDTYFRLSNGHGREIAAGSLEAVRAAARLLGVTIEYYWYVSVGALTWHGYRPSVEPIDPGDRA